MPTDYYCPHCDCRATRIVARSAKVGCWSVIRSQGVIVSVHRKLAAIATCAALAAVPAMFAAPAAHAALIDEAEVQLAFHDASGHLVGLTDLTLLGAHDSATFAVPPSAVAVTVTNDPFPLSDAPIDVTFNSAVPTPQVSPQSQRVSMDISIVFTITDSTSTTTVEVAGD